MTKARGSILVLDGDQASALAVLRSLGRAGYAVDIADSVADPLSGHSKFCRSVLRYPPPRAEAAAFIDWLIGVIKAQAYELVIPITDDSLQPMATHRDRLQPLTKMAVAPEPGLETFTDKSKTLALAASLGIPIPEGHPITSEAELDRFLDQPQIDFPVVVKPARSVAESAVGARTALSVRYAQNSQELKTLGLEALKHGELLLQSFAKGEGQGVEVLCDQGEVVAAFQHCRLHEWPLTGGGSSYRESMALNADLLADAKTLMQAALYHGVAMVEFKFDPVTKTRALMEVNARFWGSLPLCTAAGANFPLWLRDLLVEKKQPSGTNYREGIRCRKFSRDLFWSIEVLRRTDPNPLITWPARHLGFSSWLALLLPRHRFDVQSFSDFKPGWVDLKRSFALVFERFFARRQRLQAVARMKSLRRRRQPLAEQLRSARKIVMVCYGNINRSALAAADLSLRLPKVEVLGRGFHEREGRPLDPKMLALLGESAIDLENHRSQTLRRADVEGADLIFAMDAHQLLRLQKENPELKDRIYLYGVLDDEEAVEIADPYGGEEAAYRAARDRLLRLGAEVEALRES